MSDYNHFQQSKVKSVIFLPTIFSSPVHSNMKVMYELENVCFRNNRLNGSLSFKNVKILQGEVIFHLV